MPAGLALEGVVRTHLEHTVQRPATAGAHKTIRPAGLFQRGLTLAFAAKLPSWISMLFLSRAAGSGRGAKMPSFHIDLYSGRGKSEVEYLHGAVVREGKKYNVPTPVNELLTNVLLALTNKEIPLEEYANQPEKLLSALTSLKT